MKTAQILKMYSQAELAKLWGCNQSTVSYKLKHEAITIGEYRQVIKRHPEHKEVLLQALA